MLTNALRKIPSVNFLLETDAGQALLQAAPRAVVLDHLRHRLTRLRSEMALQDKPIPCSADLLADVRCALERQERQGLCRVINATGIVLHTNLGRAPLASAALKAVQNCAAGYCNLEMDLASGKRGGRGGLTSDRLCRLTGAEAALVVNNNAAGVLLALGALADGGEVAVSRGELVEIGGAFRVPDVIRQGGARLVEVGTTNKTRVSDYAKAITPDTKLLLKVHSSNFRIVGFTEETSLAELSLLAAEHGLAVVYDLGSGALIDLSAYGLPAEPTAAEAIKAGADLVCFSGDKLLGGPQCGLLVGKQSHIAQMAAHPLFRALRADKMVLAALEATLRLYEDPESLTETLPVLRMLTVPPDVLLKRAKKLSFALAKISGLTLKRVPGDSYSGGGTLPDERLPSQHLHVRSDTFTAEQLAARLREAKPPVVGRVTDDAFVIDVRTVQEDEVPEVIQAFRGAQAVKP